MSLRKSSATWVKFTVLPEAVQRPARSKSAAGWLLETATCICPEVDPSALRVICSVLPMTSWFVEPKVPVVCHWSAV